MASVQGDSGVTDFGMISSRPGFMLHAEIQGKQVLVPVSGLAEGLGDKFAPLLGEGWAEKGQFAFGPGSKAQFTKENPPVEEEQVEPVLFSATATAEGVTQELEDLPCLIIDPSQGASASVTYDGQTYEMPTAPEGAAVPYVVAYIFPKSDEYPDQVAPKVGRLWQAGFFRVFDVVDVAGGWLTMSCMVQDPGEELPPVFPLDTMDGIILLPIDNLEDLGLSYAFGDHSIASGYGSIASGDHSIASGEHSIASGSGSIASGEHSIASGDHSIASGYGSIASGDHSTASGHHSTASGPYSTASGDHSIASGEYTIASNFHSFASGYGSIASGAYSIAIGSRTTASGSGSIASGEHTIASGVLSTAMGVYNVDDATKIFIIGNGTSDTNRKNIFTIAYDGKPDCAKIPSVNGGDLVMLGIVPPAAKPAFAGQIYLDANNNKLYVAKAATATTDWVAIN